MSKKVLFLALALALVLAIGMVAVGCGDDEEPAATTAATTPATTAATTPSETTAITAAPETTAPPTTSAPAETINLTFSCHNPPGNAIASAIEEYGKYIEANSGGRVKVVLVPSGQGGAPQRSRMARISASMWSR